MTEAALDAAMAACPDQHISLGHWEPAIDRKDMRRVLEAALPHLAAHAQDAAYATGVTDGAAAERERIYAELGNDHYVIFTEDRWTVEHSVECRLSGQMPECACHAAIARIADDYYPDMAGRWKITGIDSEGLPDLLREAQP